jgi:hypothetical protein
MADRTITCAIHILCVYQHAAKKGEGHHGVLQLTVLVVHSVSFQLNEKENTLAFWDSHPVKSVRVMRPI